MERAAALLSGAERPTSGPLFPGNDNGHLCARQVAEIGKYWAKQIGVDPRRIGAHSFRRGGITSMFENGAKVAEIMNQSRHKTVNICMRYIEGKLAVQNPAIKLLGL